MANFREAYEAGLRAFDAVSHARGEVQELLREFAEQVHQASGGLISIGIGKNPVQALKQLLTDIAIVGAPPDSLKWTETSIYAARTDNGQQRELCHLTLGKLGYPVRLAYGKERVSCHDREALELALEELLKSPDTGGKYHSLLHASATSE